MKRKIIILTAMSLTLLFIMFVILSINPVPLTDSQIKEEKELCELEGKISVNFMALSTACEELNK